MLGKVLLALHAGERLLTGGVGFWGDAHQVRGTVCGLHPTCWAVIASIRNPIPPADAGACPLLIIVSELVWAQAVSGFSSAEPAHHPAIRAQGYLPPRPAL